MKVRGRATQPTRALLAVVGIVLAAGCTILDVGEPETPRQRADRALAEIRDSRDPEIRAEAAKTLGGLGLPEAVEQIGRAHV